MRGAGILSLLRHRELILIFVKRDLVGKYRGSALGILWSFVNPLFLLVIYTVVFSVFFHMQSRGGTGSRYYSVFIFSGMVPWIAFSEALRGASGIISNHANLVKKSVFPVEVLPVVSTLSGFVHSLFGLAILLLGIVVLPGQPLHLNFPLLALVMVPQLLFTLGIAWVIGSVAVFLKDVQEGMGVVLMAWWFMTPILYPPSVVPERFRPFFDLNPMKAIVDSYRAVLIGGASPEWGPLAGVTALGVVAFVAGYAWFAHAKRTFADVL